MFKKVEIPKEHKAIHEKIKKKHFFFKFHYPKTVLLVLCIILAYLIFRIPAVGDFMAHLGKLSVIGVFIAGMLLAFGFTAPFAVGFFVTLNSLSIPQFILYGFLGGLSGLLADLLIFKFIRFSFEKEFKKMERTKFATHFTRVMNSHISHKIKAYMLYGVIGLLIASPLPDEIGVVLLAGLNHVKQKIFATASFILHIIGIFLLLGI